MFGLKRKPVTGAVADKDIADQKAEASKSREIRKPQTVIDDAVTIVLRNLPVDVVIRRIRGHQGGNQWAASRDINGRPGTRHYGKTLGEALHGLIINDERLYNLYSTFTIDVLDGSETIA